jgi:hypothetical protein
MRSRVDSDGAQTAFGNDDSGPAASVGVSVSSASVAEPVSGGDVPRWLSQWSSTVLNLAPMAERQLSASTSGKPLVCVVCSDVLGCVLTE